MQNNNTFVSNTPVAGIRLTIGTGKTKSTMYVYGRSFSDVVATIQDTFGSPAATNNPTAYTGKRRGRPSKKNLWNHGAETAKQTAESLLAGVK